MFYPIVERRIATQDRRTVNDRRREIVSIDNEQRTSGSDRRSGLIRRKLNLDREKLLDNLRLPSYRDETPTPFAILRMVFLPLVVASVSAGVTYLINTNQIESANIIAKSQRESSELIAKANRDHSTNIADAELSTQKLAQIIEIFSEVVDQAANNGKEFKESTVKQKIRSLEIYKDQALPFLLRLRNYVGENQKTILETAKDSIENILAKSQLDLSYSEFKPRNKKEELNLRGRKYANYNLSDSKFINANLYNSNFSGATLSRATFKSVDLVDANFSGANLADAEFSKANLRRTNFEEAFLKGTRFENCENIEFATFSLVNLLRPKEQPISEFTPREYIALLVGHKDEIEEMYQNNLMNQDDPNLKYVLNHAQVPDFDTLIKKINDISTEKN